MWLDNSSQSLVDDFWRMSGVVETFPRDLERPLALALPIALVSLPRLRLRDIETWLQQRGSCFEFQCRSRAIRGCLIAFRGQGLIFVDGADPQDERRFTTAHEIAHFLVDYWRPRENALSRLGAKIAEVVDGLRDPTIRERVYALIGSIAIGVHTDLVERDRRLDDMSGTLWSLEDRADRVGLSLLAPPDAVLELVDLSPRDYGEREAEVTGVLRSCFGLPAAVARSYSHVLLAQSGRGPSWLETVGLR